MNGPVDQDVPVLSVRAPAGELRAILFGYSCYTTALSGYQQEREQALREVFEITCQLGAYPVVPAFTELQKQLGAAIDKEAAALAARPVPGERVLVSA